MQFTQVDCKLYTETWYLFHLWAYCISHEISDFLNQLQSTCASNCNIALERYILWDMKALKAFHINKAGWYVLAQDRQEWCKVCDRSTSSVAPDLILDFIVMDADIFLVNHRIWPDTVVAVLGCDGLRASVSCCQCQWTFRRPQDMARHRCSRSGRVWRFIDSVCHKAEGRHLLVIFYPGSGLARACVCVCVWGVGVWYVCMCVCVLICSIVVDTTVL